MQRIPLALDDNDAAVACKLTIFGPRHFGFEAVLSAELHIGLVEDLREQDDRLVARIRQIDQLGDVGWGCRYELLVEDWKPQGQVMMAAFVRLINGRGSIDGSGDRSLTKG